MYYIIRSRLATLAYILRLLWQLALLFAHALAPASSESLTTSLAASSRSKHGWILTPEAWSKLSMTLCKWNRYGYRRKEGMCKRDETLVPPFVQTVTYFLASSSWLPRRRATMSILTSLEMVLAASTRASATLPLETIPPKTLTIREEGMQCLRVAFQVHPTEFLYAPKRALGLAESRSLKASFIASASAPPPMSRKFAGLPGV